MQVENNILLNEITKLNNVPKTIVNLNYLVVDKNIWNTYRIEEAFEAKLSW